MTFEKLYIHKTSRPQISTKAKVELVRSILHLSFPDLFLFFGLGLVDFYILYFIDSYFNLSFLHYFHTNSAWSLIKINACLIYLFLLV